MKSLIRLAAAGLLGSIAATAQAQDFPARPITMIVPFAAGGPTDVIARIVNDHMSKTLGQQIIVENVAGAGGTTGIARAAGSNADGYTIMMGHMGTHGAAPALYKSIKYDPAKDFAPIGLAAGTPILIVSKNALPAKTLKEFVDYAKANEGKITEAHAGLGSVSHTTCSLLSAQTGIKANRVTYRGTGPALNDLVGGQVDFACDQIVNLVPQIKAGTIRAYAIATPERSPMLPDVQTTKEAGMPDYEVSAWNAIFAPKGTPPAVVEKLAAALDKALDDEATKKRLLDLGGVIPDKQGRSPAALQKLVESEVPRWNKAMQAAGITAQ